MTELIQDPTSGQPAPGGQPAPEPLPEPVQSSPPQPSGQPEPQGDPYWKSEYDKLQNSTRPAVEAVDWFKQNPEAAQLVRDWSEGKLAKPSTPPEDFDVESEFNIGEAVAKPESKSGKHLKDVFRTVVKEELEPMQTEMQNAQFRQKLTDSGMPTQLHDRYMKFLTNMEGNLDVVFGPMAKWFAEQEGQISQTAAPSALSDIRINRGALPPTGAIQGAPPAAPDEGEDIFQGFMKADKSGSILNIGK